MTVKGKKYKLRKNLRVIRSVRLNKTVHPEKFYREQLMLYVPWRNEKTDIDCYACFKDQYEKENESIDKKQKDYEFNEPELAVVEEQVIEDIGYVAPIIDHLEEEDENEGAVESSTLSFFDPDRPENQRNSNIGADIGLQSSGMDNVEMIAGRLLEKEYLSLVQKLNIRQHEFFTHIVHHVKTSNEPLSVFLTGGAGVGKSVVLNTLYQALDRHFSGKHGQNPDSCNVLITANTGMAAYSVKGVTIHSALKIDPNRKLQDYKKLSNDALTSLRRQYENLSVMMIDEISLVGKNMFK